MKQAVSSLAWALLAAFPSVAAAQTWTDAPVLPAPNAGHATASSNGYLYAFGGLYDPRMSSRLDPVAGVAWESLAPLPDEVPGAAAAAHQGVLYVFGGNTIRAYDPAADSWTVLPARLSELRSWMGAARLGNSIYLAGGDSGASRSALFEEFIPNAVQPALGTVRSRAMLPIPSRGALAAVDNRLYYLCYGGATPRWWTTTYSPSTDLWSSPQGAPLAYDASDRPGCFVLQSSIFYIGSNPTTAYVCEWRTSLSSIPSIVGWIPGAQARRFFGATAVDNRGYLVGGERSIAGIPEAVDQVLGYAPIFYGTPPTASNGAMRRPGGPPLPPGSAVDGPSIEFTALLSDPDSAVRLEVEVRRAAEPFGDVPTATGSWIGATTIPTITWPLSAGAWKWRYRAKDYYGNNSNWTDFGDADGVDFLYDAAPPGAPAPLSPLGGDVPVRHPTGSPVDFSWTAATDDASGVAFYEVEVSHDPGFAAPAIAAGTSAGTSAAIPLPPHRDPYHWRVRAVDFAGHIGPWSASPSFRVILVDGIDHGAGDGHRACGFGSPAAAGPAWLLALATLLATSPAASRRATRARAAARGSRAGTPRHPRAC